MKEAPDTRVIVDMDCDDIGIPPDQKRCDYLFVGEDKAAVWVVPIELKRGALRGREVVEQLQGGVHAADRWLPAGSAFRFVPVLAYGNGIHRTDLRILRKTKIKLRKLTRQTALIRCGKPLRTALRNTAES